MTDNISLSGVVATVPRVISTSSGLAITSFRLASSQRRYDRTKSAWVDGETNWYTVNTFRALAEHAAVSVFKGDRVLVDGRLRIRPWEKDGKTGTAVEVDAEALGHDLFWGTGVFTKASPAAQQTTQVGGQQAVDHRVPDHQAADRPEHEPNPTGWLQPLAGEAPPASPWSAPGTPVGIGEAPARPGTVAGFSSEPAGAASEPGLAPREPAPASAEQVPSDEVPSDPGEPAWAAADDETPF